MPDFKAHCFESISLFGKPYPEIHEWLDEFAGRAHFEMRHRQLRHHEAGIRRAVAIFGPEAENVARQHIISDLKQDCWDEKYGLPQNEADYLKMGLS